MEFASGTLRLRWDPARRLLRTWSNLAGQATREQNEACARFIQNALGATRAYVNVISWEGEGPTSLESKAFWWEFFKTFPPRRLAAVQPSKDARRGVEALGDLGGFEVRAFDAEEDAISWATT